MLQNERKITNFIDKLLILSLFGFSKVFKTKTIQQYSFFNDNREVKWCVSVRIMDNIMLSHKETIFCEKYSK